jgi:nucleoside-diphosphate-sugar epimerase
LNKKILIVGGTGFLGQNLLKKLTSENFNLYSLSSKKNNKKIKNVKYLICDVLNKSKLKKIVNENFDIVINLLGNIEHKKKVQTFNVHYKGLKNLYSIINKKKLKLFIQIGSCLEYGILNSPQKEIKKCLPISYYGKAKYLASKYVENKLKNKSIILRLYQIFGPNQKNDRLVPHVIQSCKKNKKFDCTDGSQFRDFLYIDDFSDLIIKILKRKKVKYGLYNVGYGKPIKVKNLINKIVKKIKKGKPKFGSTKMRKDEIPLLYPNTEKVKKQFNWSPKISLDTGITKTIKN